VRHGETEGQSSIRYHGSNDVPLSDLGREQIRGLLPLLSDVHFARVVHSPLQRAAESATLLADGLGLDRASLQCERDLREICFGDAEGMTREEIEAAFPGFWSDYEAGRTDSFPGGEPRVAFAERVRGAALALAADAWQGDALLVAHRGIVKQTLLALLGDDAAPSDALSVELGSLSVARQVAGGWQLDVLGMRP